jgi:hypothetical protein
MKVGVTGTREGMDQTQRLQVQQFLAQFPAGTELHHGDCLGVDVQVAAIAQELGFRIVCHPPQLSDQQGFFGGDEIREPLGYLHRDRNIVDQTDTLIVVPLQDQWQPKGGTWYTHDYAIRAGKPVTIFYPNQEKG